MVAFRAAGSSGGTTPAITSANSTTFTVGTAGSFTVTTTGTPTPTVAETGTLPSGVTFKDNGNGTATLSGTPTSGSGGPYALTMTASNGVGSPASQTVTLTVNQAPAITSGSSTTFTVGTAGSFTVTTTGTPTPSLTESGALPGGVTFKDNGNGTATLSGTPGSGSGGTYTLTITANNGVGTAATQSFTLKVNQAPAITSGSSTTFTVGTAGSFTVTTTGSPTPTLTETGTLPSGVTFVNNGNGTATLSGTPASGSGGTYSLTITPSNGVGTPASQAFTLTVRAVSSTPLGFVQANYATMPSAQSVTVTYTQVQTAGDLNVVVVGWNDSTTQIINPVTDTQGNVYVLAVGPTVQSGSATQAIYYAKNIAGAVAKGNTVTVKFNGNAMYPDIRIAEYSGVDPTNPLDVVAAAQGNGTLSSSGSVTTGNANDLLVGANLVGDVTTGPGAGYTSRVISPYGDILEDSIVTATGSYSATAPTTQAVWIMQMVAFRAAGTH
jgi:large repetitive protein